MLLRVFIAGYVACLLTIAAVGMFASAMSCDTRWVGLNTISHHFQPKEKYNERNWGAFYECSHGFLGWQAGYFRNSYDRDSFYSVAIVRPWRWERWDIGGFIGPATGYKDTLLIAGAAITYRATDRLAVQVVINPAVAGLQLMARF